MMDEMVGYEMDGMAAGAYKDGLLRAAEMAEEDAKAHRDWATEAGTGSLQLKLQHQATALKELASRLRAEAGEPKNDVD